jgi:hypothetical protein
MLVIMPSQRTSPPGSACGVARRLIHLTSYQSSTQMRPYQYHLHIADDDACME